MNAEERRQRYINLLSELDESQRQQKVPGTSLTFGELQSRMEAIQAHPSKVASDDMKYDVPVYPEGIKVHNIALCKDEDRPCLFHRPSNHHMLFWPINIRLDRFAALSERICPHGVGHPDPDSLAYVESLRPEDERGYDGMHGCDSCCTPPVEAVH